MTTQERDKQRAHREAGRKHVIDSVTFTGYLPGDGSYPSAPLTCSCSWSGVSADFAAHRREHGARMTFSRIGTERTPSAWHQRGTLRRSK